MPDMDKGDPGAEHAPGGSGPRRRGSGNGGARLGRKPTAEAVGKALAAHYADLVNAPLPEPLLALLAKLEAAEVKPASEAKHD